MNRRTVIRAAIAAAWLGMAALLVRFEAFPEYFTHSIGGYRALLSEDLLVVDSWMKLQFNGRDVGYSHAAMDASDEESGRRYQLKNRLVARVTLSGRPVELDAELESLLDAEYRLQQFTLWVTCGPQMARISGEREAGDTFRVRIRGGTAMSEMRVEIPDDVVLYSPMNTLALKRLRPGQSATLFVLDPVSLQRTSVTVRAIGSDTLELGGQPVRAMRLAMTYGGMETQAWVDRRGQVLRQEAPLGLAMERCTPEAAYAALADPPRGEDILRTISAQLLSWQL